LVEAGLYESPEESARREEVLGELDKIVKDWVKQLTSQRGYTDQMVEEANAVLFTFGSYRLGVTIILYPVFLLFSYHIHLHSFFCSIVCLV
jgi:poly(A) polymerase Pap1